MQHLKKQKGGYGSQTIANPKASIALLALMGGKMNGKISTLQISKDTQQLIRQYCFLHKLNMKNFIDELANEKLEDFKKRLDELKKLRI